jgi:hypothetical protein
MRLGSVVALLSDGEPLGDDLRQWLQRVASCLQRADVSLVVNIAGSRALGGVLWRTWAEAIRSGESHVDLGPVARSIAPVVEAADRAIVSLSLTPEAVTLEAALTLVPGTAPWAAFAQVAPHPEEALAMAGPETVAVASVGLGEGLPAWIVDKATAAIRKEDPAAAAAAGVLLSELRAPAAVVESTTNRPVLVASWRVTRATDARDLLFTFVSRITKGPAVIEAMAAVGDDPLDLFVDDDVEGHFGVVRGRGVVAVGSGAQAMLRRETSGPTSDGVRRALDRQLPSAAAFAWAATSWLEDPSAPVAQPGAGIGLSAGASTGALRARLDVPAESLAWVLHHLDGVLPDELLPEEEQARRRRDRLLIRRGGYAPPELPEGIEAELEALEALESEGEPDWAPAPPLHAPPIPQPPTSPLPLDGGFGVVEDLPIDTDFDPLGVPAPLPNTFPAAEPWE